jgi:hypothetical protein
MVDLGDGASIKYGSQVDYKMLFFSEEMACLRVPISLIPGFGKIEMGTAIARTTSANAGTRLGKYIPYDPHATVTGAEDWGRSYITADSGTSNTFFVTMADSYKYAVNDDICLAGYSESLQNLGKITAIDRTTYTHIAKITATSSISPQFTTANFAYAYIEGAETAVGVLQATVNTGTGSSAAGATGMLIIGNCVLYTGMIAGNLDSNGRTDISAATLGQYTYIR